MIETIQQDGGFTKLKVYVLVLSVLAIVRTDVCACLQNKLGNPENLSALYI